MNNQDNLHVSIEALLFWRGEAMSLSELCRALKASSSKVKEALTELRERLRGRGVALVAAGDSFALATAPEAHELIERMRKEELSRDLGRAALETLSIVLYKGEAARRDIEHVRGVNSTAILRSLLIRGLIERRQSETDERMFLYRPTVELFALLGIARAEELPECAVVRAELEEVQAEQKRQDVEDVVERETE
ncbi:MAG: SMC-Scp complex subunit ScpB [Patescibacteria group bacterium]